MEFGKSLTFFTENRHIYILPNNLKKEMLAAECIRLSSKLEAFQERHKEAIIDTSLDVISSIEITLGFQNKLSRMYSNKEISEEFSQVCYLVSSSVSPD